MKSSIHLFYGIIIGILLVACTGSLKEDKADKADKAEFEIERIVYLGQKQKTVGISEVDGVDKKIAQLKKDGWTIIDFEIYAGNDNWFHIGK